MNTNAAPATFPITDTTTTRPTGNPDRPFSWTCTACGEHGKTYTRNSMNHAAARNHVCPAPTATAKLVRTNGRVSVVRCQEPGELPVWTIHVGGAAPIYVALSRADAIRVGDYWATVPARFMDAR